MRPTRRTPPHSPTLYPLRFAVSARKKKWNDAVLLYLNETDDSPRAEQLGEHIVRGMQDLGGCINAERKFHAEGEEVALL